MSKYKKIEITPRKLRQIQDDTAKEMIVLTLAWLMDEEGYGNEKLIECYHALTRYVTAVHDKTISINTVRKILSEIADLEIVFSGGQNGM